MAQFQFTREGKRSDAWSVMGLEAEDATGNRWQSQGYSRLGDNAIATSGRVPTNELLKVRAKFMQQAEFDTNELWTVKDVALPSPGQFTVISNAAFTVDGTTITLRGVSAPNVRFPGANGWSSNPSVHFTASRPTRGPLWHLSVVDVLDEQGRRVSSRQHPFPMQVMPGIPLSFPLVYPTNLTRVTVVFALHKPRTIEFMARATVP